MVKVGRPPLSRWWKIYTWELLGTTIEPLTVRELYRQVEAKGKEEGRTDWPSLRTLIRYVHEWKRLPPEARELYGTARWPESFNAGLLDWAAAGPLLDLMELGKRPDIRQARWYWRLTQARPNAPVGIRLALAENLAFREALGTVDAAILRGAELMLVAAPWRSEERAAAYRDGLDRGLFPLPPVLTLGTQAAIGRLARSTPEERTAILEATERWVREQTERFWPEEQSEGEKHQTEGSQ